MKFLRLAALAGALFCVSAATAAAQGWGALAFSENGTAYAYIRNQESKEAAEQGALAECAKYAQDCKIYQTFENKCVTLAGATNGSYGWVVAGATATPEQRVQGAMAQCKQHGGEDCRIVVQFCSGIAGPGE